MATPSSQSASDWQLYKRLLTYIWPLKWAFLLSFVGFLCYAFMDVLAVDILQYLIDSLGGEEKVKAKALAEAGLISGFLKRHFPFEDPSNYAQVLIPLLMVLIAIGRGVGAFTGNFFMKYVGNKVVLELRYALFVQLNQLPMAYIKSKNSGKLVSRITYNVEQVTGAVTNALTTLFRDGLTVIGLFAYLIYINYKLTLTFLIVIPLIGVLVNFVSKRFRRISHRLQNSMGDITQVVTETVNSAQDIRIYGAQQTENKRFFTAIQYTFKQKIKENITDSALSPTVQILLVMAIALLVWIGLNSRSVSAISPGAFVAYLVAAGAIAKPFRQVTGVLAIIQKALAASEDIFAQLDEARELELGDFKTDSIAGELQFQQVSFCYPEAVKKTLNDINFTLKPGKMMALVGESGGGKSTLAGLIPRFYNVSEGKILLDGMPINDFRLDNLRQHIALVSQHVVLMNDTIKANIGFGLRKVNDEAIIAAAKKANAHEFILQLAQGYDTRIGDNGVMLSGGQRQRLAIARAICKNAPILILDEATSALDNESERLIQSALNEIMAEKTTIVIAHRLSTIEKADHILVLQKGRVIEQGNHQALLEAAGYYARLHQSHAS